MKLVSQVTSEIILIFMCILVIFVLCRRSGYSIDFNGPIIDVKPKPMTEPYFGWLLTGVKTKVDTPLPTLFSPLYVMILRVWQGRVSLSQ